MTIITSTKATTRSRFSPEEKQAHVLAFKASQQSQATYCQAHGIAPSSFCNWLRQYATSPAAGFKPVHISPIATPNAMVTSSTAPTSATRATIDFQQGDLCIKLPMMHDTQTIAQLIKAVLSCS